MTIFKTKAPTASTIDAVHVLNTDVIGPMTDYQIGPQQTVDCSSLATFEYRSEVRRAVDTQCTTCGTAVTLLGPCVLAMGIDRELSDDDEIAIVLTDADGSGHIVCGACATRAVTYADVDHCDDVPARLVVDEDGDDTFDVPSWIDDDITINQIRSVTEGGCDSGAYMLACAYYSATETMKEYGDDVVQYIEDSGSEVPAFKAGQSWVGYVCTVLSTAVEIWCSSADSTLDNGACYYIARDADDG